MYYSLPYFNGIKKQICCFKFFSC